MNTPPRKPTIPSMKRRASWHDYSKPGTYMLTITTEGRKPLFGRLSAMPHPHIELSVLGSRILHTESKKMNAVYPNVHLWKICIMPDHLHLLVNVSESFPEGKELGNVITGFKIGCNRAYKDVNPGADGALFEEGYNDRILLAGMEADQWAEYMEDNPRRAIIKRDNPHLFTTLYDYEVVGRNCQIFGNQFLLDIPAKMAVVVHRADDDATYAQKCRQWLRCVDRGGVLVSAAIAQREKWVMREAMNHGGRVILLRENGFPPLYKPSGEAFDTCAEGRLLQISPWQYHNEQRTITREQCLALNRLAEDIAGTPPPTRQ